MDDLDHRGSGCSAPADHSPWPSYGAATDMPKLIDREDKVCAHNYKPLPVVLDRGLGEWLWDIEGKRYLDMMSAYSAVSHGHSNPRLVTALHDQACKLAITSRAFHTDKLAPFLEKLCDLTGLDMAMPMNTGAEAVETAIKAARRWGYRTKHIPADRAEIIVARDNFHGRTTTIVGFSSDEAYRKDFGPFAPGFVEVPFGDAQAVADAITPNTCAVMVEPMQGEAGIQMPPDSWLGDLRAICDRENVLLLLDEIQTGLGRTGKLFAFQHTDGLLPDGLMLGKALGGGLLPVSAFVGTRAVMDLFDPGSHGSTFGGNPLGAAVGLEALTILVEDDLTERSRQLGERMQCRLKQIQSKENVPDDQKIIREVRGAGLWVGVEINPDRADARDICERLMVRGVLSKETHETVVRFAPPLMIDQDALDWGIEQFEAVLDEIR